MIETLSIIKTEYGFTDWAKINQLSVIYRQRRKHEDEDEDVF